MIKVGIIGAASAQAGELIRILAMHPDVEIMAAQSAAHEGCKLTSVHHGLIGETDLCFTASADLQRCDILFNCSPEMGDEKLKQIRDDHKDIKTITLTRRGAVTAEDEDGGVYGLSEINRKSLVRGARHARVPSPFASMALVALYPFAVNLLLNDSLQINIQAPSDLIKEETIEDARREIETVLKSVQQSFDASINVAISESNTRRSALMEIDFPCTLSAAQGVSLYDFYDDHHFAFAGTEAVGVSEVAGTEKCVVTVSKPDASTMRLTSVADGRMRGAAGEAVHIMNLMCGLHERTGLALKAIDYTSI